jgi:hypothetical protein
MLEVCWKAVKVLWVLLLVQVQVLWVQVELWVWVQQWH